MPRSVLNEFAGLDPAALCKNICLDGRILDKDHKFFKSKTEKPVENNEVKDFPWIKQINDECLRSFRDRSIKTLESLVVLFNKLVIKDANDSFTKPNRAAKLKKIINEYVIFFNGFYQEVKESLEQTSYFQHMSQLLSVYLDMEIQAHVRGRENPKKIVSRIVATLYSALDSSMEYILDAVLKCRSFLRPFAEMCSTILSKILHDIRPQQLDELLYIRYLLTFKLWKLLVTDTNKKKEITKLAEEKLIMPTSLLEKPKLITEILHPIPKKKRKNITQFIMVSKISVRNSCEKLYGQSLKHLNDPLSSGISGTSFSRNKSNFGRSDYPNIFSNFEPMESFPSSDYVPSGPSIAIDPLLDKISESRNRKRTLSACSTGAGKRREKRRKRDTNSNEVTCQDTSKDTVEHVDNKGSYKQMLKIDNKEYSQGSSTENQNKAILDCLISMPPPPPPPPLPPNSPPVQPPPPVTRTEMDYLDDDDEEDDDDDDDDISVDDIDTPDTDVRVKEETSSPSPESVDVAEHPNSLNTQVETILGEVEQSVQSSENVATKTEPAEELTVNENASSTGPEETTIVSECPETVDAHINAEQHITENQIQEDNIFPADISNENSNIEDTNKRKTESLVPDPPTGSVCNVKEKPRRDHAKTKSRDPLMCAGDQFNNIDLDETLNDYFINARHKNNTVSVMIPVNESDYDLDEVDDSEFDTSCLSPYLDSYSTTELVSFNRYTSRVETVPLDSILENAFCGSTAGSYSPDYLVPPDEIIADSPVKVIPKSVADSPVKSMPMNVAESRVKLMPKSVAESPVKSIPIVKKSAGVNSKTKTGDLSMKTTLPAHVVSKKVTPIAKNKFTLPANVSNTKLTPPASDSKKNLTSSANVGAKKLIAPAKVSKKKPSAAAGIVKTIVAATADVPKKKVIALADVVKKVVSASADIATVKVTAPANFAKKKLTSPANVATKKSTPPSTSPATGVPKQRILKLSQVEKVSMKPCNEGKSNPKSSTITKQGKTEKKRNVVDFSADPSKLRGKSNAVLSDESFHRILGGLSVNEIISLGKSLQREHRIAPGTPAIKDVKPTQKESYGAQLQNLFNNHTYDFLGRGSQKTSKSKTANVKKQTPQKIGKTNKSCMYANFEVTKEHLYNTDFVSEFLKPSVKKSDSNSHSDLMVSKTTDANLPKKLKVENSKQGKAKPMKSRQIKIQTVIFPDFIVRFAIFYNKLYPISNPLSKLNCKILSHFMDKLLKSKKAEVPLTGKKAEDETAAKQNKQAIRKPVALQAKKTLSNCSSLSSSTSKNKFVGKKLSSTDTSSPGSSVNLSKIIPKHKKCVLTSKSLTKDYIVDGSFSSKTPVKTAKNKNVSLSTSSATLVAHSCEDTVYSNLNDEICPAPPVEDSPLSNETNDVLKVTDTQTVTSNDSDSNSLVVTSNESDSNSLVVTSNESDSNSLIVTSNESDNNTFAVTSNESDSNVAVTSNESDNDTLAVMSNESDINTFDVTSNESDSNALAVMSNESDSNVLAVTSNESDSNILAATSNESAINTFAVIYNDSDSNTLAVTSTEGDSNTLAATSKINKLSTLSVNSEEIPLIKTSNTENHLTVSSSDDNPLAMASSINDDNTLANVYDKNTLGLTVNELSSVSELDNVDELPAVIPSENDLTKMTIDTSASDIESACEISSYNSTLNLDRVFSDMKIVNQADLAESEAIVEKSDIIHFNQNEDSAISDDDEDALVIALPENEDSEIENEKEMNKVENKLCTNIEVESEVDDDCAALFKHSSEPPPLIQLETLPENQDDIRFMELQAQLASIHAEEDNPPIEDDVACASPVSVAEYVDIDIEDVESSNIDVETVSSEWKLDDNLLGESSENEENTNLATTTESVIEVNETSDQRAASSNSEETEIDELDSPQSNFSLKERDTCEDPIKQQIESAIKTLESERTAGEEPPLFVSSTVSSQKTVPRVSLPLKKRWNAAANNRNENTCESTNNACETTPAEILTNNILPSCYPSQLMISIAELKDSGQMDQRIIRHRETNERPPPLYSTNNANLSPYEMLPQNMSYNARMPSLIVDPRNHQTSPSIYVNELNFNALSAQANYPQNMNPQGAYRNYEVFSSSLPSNSQQAMSVLQAPFPSSHGRVSHIPNNTPDISDCSNLVTSSSRQNSQSRYRSTSGVRAPDSLIQIAVQYDKSPRVGHRLNSDIREMVDRSRIPVDYSTASVVDNRSRNSRKGRKRNEDETWKMRQRK